MAAEKYDHVFLGILQDCVQIQPFLEAIFSFLARRTDFLRVMAKEGDKMGFPPGVAENIVRSLFLKYQGLVLGTYDPNNDKENRKSKKKSGSKKTADGHPKPPEKAASKEETPKTETSKSEPQGVEESKENAPSVVESTVEVTTSQDLPEEPSAPVNEAEPSTAEDSHGIEGQEAAEQPEQAAAAAAAAAAVTDESKTESTSTESKGLAPGTQPDCYNGAALDNYVWSQTIHDIDIKVPVPSCVRKARDVGVDIKNSSLKVYIKANVPPEELKSGSKSLVEGKLQRHVKCEECMWSLEAGKCVLINLEKTEERYWTTVIEGDPEIDKTKLDTTRDIHDFDEQTQSDYAQVMYDHQQKIMGKPTIKEQKNQDILKKAWNAKGSPFAGTPFDPSKVNIS